MKTTMKALGIVGLLLSLVSSAQANGGGWTNNIGFEDGDYGVGAYDNKPIQYDYSPGAMVTFYTKPFGDTSWGTVGGFAYLEEMGGTTSGPEGPGGSGGGQTAGFNYTQDTLGGTVVDQVANDSGTGYLDGLTVAERQAAMGSYFLRTTSFSTESLVVRMDTWRMQEVSFEIWDIDGNPVNGSTEEWKVTAFDGDWVTPVGIWYTPLIGNHLDSTSYDAQPCLMTLDGGIGFDRFVIEFTGNKTANVGLAFNNFTFSVIPEPTMVALLGLGLVAFVFRRHFV